MSKSDKMQDLPSILSLYRNEFNTLKKKQEHILKILLIIEAKTILKLHLFILIYDLKSSQTRCHVINFI